MIGPQGGQLIGRWTLSLLAQCCAVLVIDQFSAAVNSGQRVLMGLKGTDVALTDRENDGTWEMLGSRGPTAQWRHPLLHSVAGHRCQLNWWQCWMIEGDRHHLVKHPTNRNNDAISRT